CAAAVGCSAEAVPRREDPARPPPSVPAGGVLLSGAGATFPSILYDEWFTAYRSERRTVAVAYEAVGSGEGVRRFGGTNAKDDERVDFGASDAAMSDEEIARVPAGALLVPVTAGSVALAYNLPGLPAGLRLSRQAVEGIFLGQITSWND